MFYTARNFLKMGIKMPRVVVFWTTSTMKDEKSAAKFHNIKTVSGKVLVHSIAFRVLSIYWQGDDPFPLKSCLQVTCPLLSMVSYGDVRTRNSRTDGPRIVKLRGEVDPLDPPCMTTDQSQKVKGQRSMSQGRVTYQQQ